MSDMPKIPSSQDPRNWSEPTPAPVNLCGGYAEDLEVLRLGYIEAAAERIATWFFDNYEDPVHHSPVDEGQYLWPTSDVEDIIRRAFWDLPEEFAEEVVAAALCEIEIDACVPLFGPSDIDFLCGDPDGCRITTVDLEQSEAGGYTGA